MTRKRAKVVKAWAWKLEDGSLCWWVEAKRIFLLADGKPSPGAKAVRVEIRELPKRKRTKGSTR